MEAVDREAVRADPRQYLSNSFKYALDGLHLNYAACPSRNF